MSHSMSDEPARKTVLKAERGCHRRTLLTSTFIAVASDVFATEESGATTLSAGAQPLRASTPGQEPGPQSAPGGPAPKLTGIRVTQRYPIGATAKFLAWVAYFDP